MRRVITPEEKLQSSLKKIESVFYRMQRNKISLREGKGLSDSSIKTYKDLMISLMKDIYKSTGNPDIARVKEADILCEIQKRVKNYKAGSENESYNIKTIRSAVKSFALGSTETKVFKNKMNFDGKKIDKLIKEEKIIRRSRFTSNLKATVKESEKVIKNIETQGYRTPTKKLAAAALQVATFSGARISAALRLKPEHIIENMDGTLTVWFFDDKGGLDHKTDIFIPEHVDFFKELKRSGNPGQTILKGKRKNGTFKSTETLRREISKIVSNFGSEFTKEKSIRFRKNGVRVTKKVEVKYTTHSGRKSFVDERVKFYWDLLAKKSFEKILEERRPDEYKKIMEKYKKEVEKVNSYNTNKRDLNREELSIFLTSLDTGHYRNNVLRQYYLDLPRFRKYQKENP